MIHILDEPDAVVQYVLVSAVNYEIWQSPRNSKDNSWSSTAKLWIEVIRVGCQTNIANFNVWLSYNITNWFKFERLTIEWWIKDFEVKHSL